MRAKLAWQSIQMKLLLVVGLFVAQPVARAAAISSAAKNVHLVVIIAAKIQLICQSRRFSGCKFGVVTNIS